MEQGFVPETLSAETAEKLFQELLLPLTRDMAAAIFTPERIRQLVEDLKQYRNRLFASEDKIAAGEIMGAITYLEREDSPGENSFLVTLCWTSLTAATEALASECG